MSTDARQPGPITFGELLSRAWRMYRAEPLLFLILTAVTVIPVGILSGIASAAATDATSTQRAAAVIFIAVIPATASVPVPPSSVWGCGSGSSSAPWCW